MTAVSSVDETVDAVFPLEGLALRRDHAQSLQLALRERLSWLGEDFRTGIHPVKVVHGSEDSALLPRRARLLIRVVKDRYDDLTDLAGAEINVDGHLVHLGTPHVRELEPHATMYAYRVAAQSDDELPFMAAVNAELADLAIGGERVCGKRHTMVLSGAVLHTFSLMLHQLSPEQSLRLQQHGLGPHRLLGCGIFVPHKSAAAV